ncbi:MAG TPA: ABC transporter permease [Candidatus Hydrogenedentes bacterium]|nr:ABC transporter permease [Candidatus Hydrogenedentota bacterium]HOC71584.1 ABC transporter permease [Candidatus Hydrogenedentota bacterium]HOH50349.1 ABC transporter permease [Candidatus Hydrogenedentota bacterium]
MAEGAGAARMDSLRRNLWTFGPLVAALFLELAVFEMIGRSQDNPGFTSFNTMMMVLNQSAIFGVMAVGMTFVIITGGIDLSVGSLMAFGGVLSATVVRHGQSPAWVWILLGWCAALGVGMCAGSATGLLVTRLRIPPFIATLALMSSLRGLGNLLTDGKPISPLPPEYTWLGRGQLFGELPVSVVLFMLVLAAGFVLLNHTRFGRYTRAIGGNEESARLSGVPVMRVKWLVYTLCGALAVMAGLMLTSRLGSGDPKIGLGDELSVIAAVVVGGTSLSGGRGSIAGTFVGLLVVSVLNSGLNWIGVETFGQQVTLGLVILAAVLLDRVKGE